MTKKILLLILSLPLILMISLFTTTDTVSLAIKVPVTGVEYIGSKIVYLDLDEEENYEIKYTVYPTNAHNQEVTFKAEKINDERLAKLEFKNGYIIPKGVGSAKVYITTNDGGFQDSFIVQVDSDSLQEIESTISKDTIYVGKKVFITTEFIPSNAANRMLTYKSSNESVAIVDEQGFITGIGKGTATITVSSIVEGIYDTVEITVLNQDIMDLGQTEVTTWNMEGSINVSIDTPVAYNLTAVAYDANNNLIPKDIITLTFDTTNEANGQIVVNYEFKTNYVGLVLVTLKIETELGLELTKECEINRVNEISVSFGSYENHIPTYTVGQSDYIFPTVTPADADVTYEVTSDDNVTVKMAGKKIMVVANKVGVSTIKLKVANSLQPEQYKEAEIEVVVVPKSFTIEELANTYGIENIWTVGKENADGTPSTFDLHLSLGNEEHLSEGFADYITWTSSSNKVEIIKKDKKTATFKIIDASLNEIVTLTATYGVNGVALVTTSYKVRCVGDAVNVYNYLDLYESTSNNKAVVLHANIKDRFGYDAQGNVVYKEVKTTYDDTYLVKAGHNNKIKILLDIKNNVYGNGYEINANNIAGVDETGNPKGLFKEGPLNFVGCGDANNSSLISVKGQDNVVFAIYENVCLNNVQLKGCDLTAEADVTYNLKDLNYSGTTVEVFGDNVSIINSRISNGRTVLRIFGDIDDSTKVINVNISNSVLSTAREFIIRMGSNCFIEGTKDNYAPLIDNEIKQFPVYPQYSKMTAQQKADYDKKYIKTFVNIKDTAFGNSGIFAIGIDSHFAGYYLNDGKNSTLANGSAILKQFLQYWEGLAKTSYGAKLTFEGDVRIYDWKDIEKVDSSTLIDIHESVEGNSNYAFLSEMRLDIQIMVKSLVDKESLAYKEEYKNILFEYDGKKYVHGGIAFFGGGKNYGTFEMKDYNFYALNGYKIRLFDAGRGDLESAAGEEAFYFLMHDATTFNFTPAKQDEILASGEAYNFVYPTK